MQRSVPRQSDECASHHPIPGFKLKDFLRDKETLSSFLHRNASLSHHAVQQIVEADLNLEKVNVLTVCEEKRESFSLWLSPHRVTF